MKISAFFKNEVGYQLGLDDRDFELLWTQIDTHQMWGCLL